MKNYFPADYCPQHEKVLDLSRVVLSGGRRYARHRRAAGRLTHKVERQEIRRTMRAATKLVCECAVDEDGVCPRCHGDSLPTRSEIVTGETRWLWIIVYLQFHGPADDLGPLFNWVTNRTAGMTWTEIEEFLRAHFLSRKRGNSLQTRHAYDHLLESLRWKYRVALRQGQFE